MKQSWKISYWVIGCLVLIIILSLIPWENTLNSQPKVGIVDINEPISDARKIIENINYFYKESSISAIVVRIESPGGGVAASQEIYEKVKKISEENLKPIIASMGGVAASGGYYIALGADTIIANPGTATGSIGVIMKYPVIEKMLDKIGIDYNSISSGKLKNAGSIFKKLKDDEREYFQNLINDLYDQFVFTVSKERNISLARTKELATGQIYSGSQAFKLGLIDLMGTMEDAIILAAKNSGIPGSPKIVYPPDEKKGLLNTLFGDIFKGSKIENLISYPQPEYKVEF